MNRVPPVCRHVRLRALPCLRVAVLTAVLGLQSPVHAVGVGRPVTQSALGQALNLWFPVRLASDEQLSPDCVQAEITAGESRLANAQVFVQLDGQTESTVRAVRVRSTVQIDEPVVQVSLSLGCGVRLTRQFTAFIDPPDARQAEASAPETVLSPQTLSPALRAALATSEAKPSQLLAPSQRESQAPRAEALSVASAAAASAPAAKSSTKSRVRKPRAEPATAPALAQANAPRSPASAPDAPGRLRMEAPEVLEAAASAASAVTEAEQRLAKMEAAMQALQSQSLRQQDELLKVRQRLAEAERASTSPRDDRALYWLGALSVGLSGLAAWLAWTLRRERKLHQQAWWAADEAAASASGGESSADQDERAADAENSAHLAVQSALPHPSPLASKPIQETKTSAAEAIVAAAAALADPHSDPSGDAPPDAEWIDDEPSNDFNEEAAHSAFLTELIAEGVEDPNWLTSSPGAEEALTVQLLDSAAASGAPVSVEELIDLEQQVEFFLVLGQEEAAIELLSERLDQQRRGAALPHLKLLELLQRRGDQPGYQRIAEDFSRRYGARAPDWTDDIARGQDLPDYPIAMAQIESQWSDAGATMALLQRLLAQGDEAGHGFDLPAYRDLLMLYAVARDRSEHEVRGEEEIDVFLPLDKASADAPESAGMMATMVWQAPGAPSRAAPVAVDVDLSLGDPR